MLLVDDYLGEEYSKIVAEGYYLAWIFNINVLPMVAFRSDYLTSLWRPVLMTILLAFLIRAQFTVKTRPGEQYFSLTISLFLTLLLLNYLTMKEQA